MHRIASNSKRCAFSATGVRKKGDSLTGRRNPYKHCWLVRKSLLDIHLGIYWLIE